MVRNSYRLIIQQPELCVHEAKPIHHLSVKSPGSTLLVTATVISPPLRRTQQFHYALCMQINVACNDPELMLILMMRAKRGGRVTTNSEIIFCCRKTFILQLGLCCRQTVPTLTSVQKLWSIGSCEWSTEYCVL